MEGGEKDQPRQQQQPQEVNILTQIQELQQDITQQLREVVRLLQLQQPQPLQGPPPPPQEHGWANSPVAMVIIYGNGYTEYVDLEMARAAPVNLGAGGPHRIRRQGPPYPNI